MALGKNQTDYQKYFAFFKNNYQKGIHNLSTLLSTPTQAEEFIHNLGGVSVVFGVPYSNKDANSDKLFDMLMSSGDYGKIALDTWLNDKYGAGLEELAANTTEAEAKRDLISRDAVSFRAVASTDKLSIFITTAMQYEAAAKVIAGAYLPLYQLLMDKPSYNIAYTQQHDTLVLGDSNTVYKALLKYCGFSNDDNDITNDTSITNLDTFLRDQVCMNIAGKSYTALMTLVSMLIVADTLTSEGQPVLNEAVSNSPKTVIEDIVGQIRPMQHIIASDHLWEAFFNARYGVGLGLSTLYGITTSSFATIYNIVNSASAMEAVVASGDCIVNMLRSETALAAIASSTIAMSKLIGSEAAMIAIANSQNAMSTLAAMPNVMDLIVNQAVDTQKGYPIAMHAIANSEIAMEIIANSQMAIDKIFSVGTAVTQIMGSPIAYKALNRSPIALNAIFGNSNSTIVDSYLKSADVRKDLINESKVGMEYISTKGAYTTILLNNEPCLMLIVNSQNAMNALSSDSTSRTAIWTNTNGKETLMGNNTDIPSNVMCIAKLIAGYAGLDPNKYNTCKELFAMENDIKEVLNNSNSRDLTFNYETPARELVAAECTSYDVNGSGSVIHAISVVAAHIVGMGALVAASVGMTQVARSNQALLDILSRINSTGQRDALETMTKSNNAMARIFENPKELNLSTNISATMYLAQNQIAMEYIAKEINSIDCLVNSSRSTATTGPEMEMVENTGVAAPAICTNVSVARPALIKYDVDGSMLIKMINNTTWFKLMEDNGWFTAMAKDDDTGSQSRAWNAIAASATAMNAIAASATAMNALNTITTNINILLNSRIAMFYLGKYNTNTTTKSNFATTNGNIIGRNDSLISAYYAGWLGAAAYDTYTDMAGILANNSYLTALAGNSTLMTLMNANAATCTAIGANLTPAYNNSNYTFLNACGSRANIMTAIDANSSARALIVSSIAKSIAATTFWTGCCTKVAIMNAVAASSTAMNAVAASSTAMNAVAASSTAISIVINSYVAFPIILSKSTAVTILANNNNNINMISTSANTIKMLAQYNNYSSNFIIILQKINANLSYIRNVFAILSNSSYFTVSANSGGQDGVTALNNYGTTSNGEIMACSCGYWSSSTSQWTNIFTNGVQVNTPLINNQYRPGSIDSSNVGAIASPVMTATETSDGYACAYAYRRV